MYLARLTFPGIMEPLLDQYVNFKIEINVESRPKLSSTVGNKMPETT